MLGNGNYRRQSYVDLERNFLNTDSEIVEEFNGDSGSTKNFWIGLSDVEVEGVLKWNTSNVQPSYTYWLGRVNMNLENLKIKKKC